MKKPNDSDIITLLCLLSQAKLYSEYLKSYTQHELKFRLSNLSNSCNSVINKIKSDFKEFDWNENYEISVCFGRFLEAFNENDTRMKEILIQLVNAIVDKKINCDEIIDVFENLDKFKEFCSI